MAGVAGAVTARDATTGVVAWTANVSGSVSRVIASPANAQVRDMLFCRKELMEGGGGAREVRWVVAMDGADVSASGCVGGV